MFIMRNLASNSMLSVLLNRAHFIVNTDDLCEFHLSGEL